MGSHRLMLPAVWVCTACSYTPVSVDGSCEGEGCPTACAGDCGPPNEVEEVEVKEVEVPDVEVPDAEVPEVPDVEVPVVHTDDAVASCSGDCGLPLGAACTEPAGCSSGFCANGVCCVSACDGTCMACGADGLCNEAPPADLGCMASCDAFDTPCRDHGPTSACAAFGQCAAATRETCTWLIDAESGTPCREAFGACDTADACDGAGLCVDARLPAGTSCRASTGACDQAELCDGESIACPSDTGALCGDVVVRSIGTAAPTVNVCTVEASGRVDFVLPVDPNVNVGDRLLVSGVHTFFITTLDADRYGGTSSPPPPLLAPNLICELSRAFGSLQAWEAALPRDPLESHRGIVYESVSGKLDIEGTNTSAGYRIILEPGSWHSGLAGTGVVLTGSDELKVRDDHVTIRGFEIAGGVVKVERRDVVLERLLIYGGAGDAVTLESNSQVLVRNLVVHGRDGRAVMAKGLAGGLDNATLVGNRLGVEAVAGFPVTNVIAMQNEDGDFVGGALSHCVSSDASADTDTSIAGEPASAYFVSLTPGAENLHLLPAAAAVDQGLDVSVVFSEDIGGGARPYGFGWDIGADEVGPETAPGSCGSCLFHESCCEGECRSVLELCVEILPGL